MKDSTAIQSQQSPLRNRCLRCGVPKKYVGLCGICATSQNAGAYLEPQVAATQSLAQVPDRCLNCGQPFRHHDNEAALCPDSDGATSWLAAVQSQQAQVSDPDYP